MKFDVLHGIDKLVPAAKLVIRGEQIYENVEWLDERPMPTKEEVEAVLATLPEEFAARQQAQVDARQSALNKLMALGLTEEEALALGK